MKKRSSNHKIKIKKRKFNLGKDDSNANQEENI